MWMQRIVWIRAPRMPHGMDITRWTNRMRNMQKWIQIHHGTNTKRKPCYVHHPLFTMVHHRVYPDTHGRYTIPIHHLPLYASPCFGWIKYYTFQGSQTGVGIHCRFFIVAGLVHARRCHWLYRCMCIRYTMPILHTRNQKITIHHTLPHLWTLFIKHDIMCMPCTPHLRTTYK